ncbi:ZmpA/ZmpB/ZmpC family metallo-endopeptidase-related protein [Endozoicomonas sp. ONNA2]|uniref:ZmpA/ZmpB/ZmpC family metallo-endopeptidase-related protein n=1 Tax=Endozoicomonas sp. ONNA2 TaxID=2828741 RepID=UPI0021479042|nr:ZmpA/ZmpB/ZmpC family metallo-endopeptidase-related protein [Endozoicomonas sp. ONNA2]
MIQPQNVSGGGSASGWRPETITSAQPQGRWGSLDVFRESGVVTFLPDNTCDGTPENDNDEDTQQSLSLQHRKTASLAQRAGQRPNTALVLGVLSGLAAVGMALPSNRDNDPWIPVADAETLGKIGQVPDRPLNGNYRQTVAYIDGGQLRQSIGNDTHPFTGIILGEKGTIGNLTKCLLETLAGEGRVEDLSFTDVNIRSKGPTAVVACKISDKATVSNICVDNARVVAFGKDAHAGIAGGDVRGGTVANTTAVNCTVVASSFTFDIGNTAKAGIGAGRLLGGKVANTTAVNCTVAASARNLGSVGAGIGAGYVGDNNYNYLGDNNIVANTKAVNCTVTASHGGRGGAAGIGAGYLLRKGIVANTTAVNCKVVSPYGGWAGIGVGRIKGATLANTTAVNCKVSTSFGGAGIGAGWLEHYTSRVTNTTAVNCQVENAGATESEFSGIGSAGIGAGYARTFGTVADTTAVNCQVVTSGMKGGAGIGVGRASFGGTVVNTSAMNCTVKASGKRGMAGIGAGMVNDTPTVANTTAVNCNVSSYGHGGSAGIGAGMVRRSTVSKTIADTTALNCTVLTLGDESTAGIGAGDIDSGGAIVSTKALNCKVDNLGKNSKADFRGGRNPDICNVGINGHWLNNTDHRCGLDNLCAGIDHRLVTRDCQPGDDDFMELIRNNTRQFELCPVTPTILPPTSSKSGPTMTMLGLSNASIVSVPTTPGKSGTAASRLDGVAIAGIALGGVLLLLIGVGVCIYRYCCHRARAAGSHYEPQRQGGQSFR